jgi:hypothetical protein
VALSSAIRAHHGGVDIARPGSVSGRNVWMLTKSTPGPTDESGRTLMNSLELVWRDDESRRAVK